MNAVKKAFQGETVFFPDVKVPPEDIPQRYGIRDLDVEAVYQDITLFPIPDDKQKVAYVVALLINRRVYRGRNEIEKAKEYIENCWKDPYDAEKTAKAACLSKSHFAKLFKKCTGVTPREYHLNYRIEKLKEMLRDTNLTVAQAFAACNMEYNGHSAKVFKEKPVSLLPNIERCSHRKRGDLWCLSMRICNKEWMNQSGHYPISRNCLPKWWSYSPTQFRFLPLTARQR